MHVPAISVCMPMYNASRYLRECIDSILAQTFTDFELLIVDDGSTDDSRDIVRSYDDQRIRLICNKHDYIESLNTLLREARGKYIARMDADDVMMPERLSIEWIFMENHRDVDVLGGQMYMFNNGSQKDSFRKTQVKEGYVSLTDMIEYCCVCHPTVMLRNTTINRLTYNQEAKYAEDYELWIDILSAGKNIYNLSEPLIYYRLHDAQTSNIHNNEQQQYSSVIKGKAVENLVSLTQKAFNEQVDIPASTKKLTVVIPFLNEREEVRNTVKSVRETAGMNVEIIVINDDSETNYDYESDLAGLDVLYIKNAYRIGAALSKERGVQLCKTPFFLLLDAHMRFFSNDWSEYLTHELDSDSERLLCSSSIVLEKDDKGSVIISNNNAEANGAFLTFKNDCYIPGIHWNYYKGFLPTNKPNQIPCVLGAGYATSKSYWNKIRGLKGLVHYGCEEAYISIKSWMQGGGCYLLPKLRIGHIYRKKFPYKVHSFECTYNYLLISETLFPLADRCYARAIAWKTNRKSFENAMLLLQCRKHYNLQLEKYYNTYLTGKDFAYVKHLNEICEKMAYSKKRISEDMIPKVLDHISEKMSIDMGIGLYDGLTGIFATALFCIRMKFGKSEKIAFDSWSILSTHMKKEYNVNFQSGLSGIGWFLIYASLHNLLEDDIEEELKIIDKRITLTSIKRNSDLSFLNGIGGIYCYVVSRLVYKRKKNVASFLTNDFIEELKNETNRILENTSDWRTMNYVWQFRSVERIDATTYLPTFSEVINLPDFIPKSKEYWKISLNGVLGSVISKLIK